jgi:hypothetical protein
MYMVLWNGSKFARGMAGWRDGADLRRRRHGGAWDGMGKEERRGISEGGKGEVGGVYIFGVG